MLELRTALSLAALLATLPVTAMAQASQRIERGIEEISDQITHPCNGEPVTIVGTLDVTSRRTVDANGVVHFSATIVPHIRGEGPSGEYIVRDVTHINDKFIDDEFFPENISSKVDFFLIGKGKAPNFMYSMNHHFLVEPDGTVKVDFRHEVARCTGRS